MYRAVGQCSFDLSHFAQSGIVRGARRANKTNKRQLEISAWAFPSEEAILKVVDEENSTGVNELAEVFIQNGTTEA